MHFEELRRAVEASPRAALADMAKALWRAMTEGLVSEAQAEALSALIEAKRAIPAKLAPSRVGSRPITDASLERRRRWAASGMMPPNVACHFTPGEQAALAVVALEVSRTGACRWPMGRIAGVAGVSVSTVKRALREAKHLGLIEVEERRVTWWRNDSNVVRITSPAWVAWLVRGGGQSRTRTDNKGFTGSSETSGTGSRGIRGGERGNQIRHNGPPLRSPDRWRRSAGPAGR